MKVLVCDDIQSRAKRTRRQINNATGHDVEILAEGALTTAITVLMQRAGGLLGNGQGGALGTTAACAFDGGFDVAILDNNLSELRIDGARHTAESIAGYVRAFVDLPYIVSLNKTPHVDFDLRHLIGDHDTHTDLALNGAHLANRALWTGDPADAMDEFVPWYWPTLDDIAERRRAQIRFVVEHFEDPILASLGVPAEAAAHGLSRRAKGALSPEARNVAGITFREFFEKTCRSLPIPGHRQKLSKMMADRNTTRDAVGRVVAAELDRWVRRDLLGPQDVLVDLPHLLMRMPFLLGDNARDVERWNETIHAPQAPYGLDGNTYEGHLSNVRFQCEAWTKSPCFWWGSLKANAELSRMFFEKAATPWAAAVFCEDISRFRLSAGGGAGVPKEFAGEFEGTWSRRHVAYVKGRRYRPQSRLVK